ncbi:uncharacterized protein V2V93DRAFT_376725 [Kockiozyma suomiensis]|uniref:uncharacterized protein n=1 Tax=Kockiozyma suomiensis TaxID=1337062 RepID=UPI0033440543
MSTSSSPSPEMYFGVLVLPNPSVSSRDEDQEIYTVPSSLSFEDSYDSAGVLHEASRSSGEDISGLLYVPTIDTDSSTCGTDDIPGNVTTIADLPSGYNIVAIAPLTDSSCASLWMKQAHTDGAVNMIFYEPSQSSNTSFYSASSQKAAAALVGDVSAATYSIYYLPASLGQQMISYLSVYSGNMTGLPHGSELINYFDFRDYVRVAVEIDSNSSRHVLGLWIYLVIAVVVVIVAVVSTSLAVHLFQYRNRRRLRRRMQNGEIDLESLGIKRLTVPKWILEKLPVRVYVPGELNYTAPKQMHSSSSPAATPSAVTTGYSQQSCPICLDDFEVNVTSVRELPCLHIYHLGCIDDFLEHQSSLCPLCKQSALPKGYIPPTLRITNATVRRERRLRRERERSARSTASHIETTGVTGALARGTGRFMRAVSGVRSGVLRRTPQREAQSDDVELQELSHPTVVTSESSTIANDDTLTPPAPQQEEQLQQQHQQPRRTGFVRHIHLPHRPARNTPGAMVASDGTVFVVEDDEERDTSRRRFIRYLFPYIS